MKIFVKMIKRIVFGAFLLYGYNLIAVNFNMVIPINFWTLLFITFFGVPSILALLLFKLLVL